MKGFTCKQTITYKGIRPDLTVSFSQFVSFILEASLLHTESTNYPMKWFEENKMGFLLTNWQIKVSKYPKWNDVIKINTWPIYFKGILAERYFEVFDKNENIIAKALSSWVFMDLEKRRPVKAKTEIAESYGKIYPANMDKDFFIQLENDFKEISSKTITVERSNTDSNNHANNVAYIEWAEDSIPDNDKKILETKISYKKECRKGDSIKIHTYQKNNNFVVQIRKQEDDILLSEILFVMG